jgi:hypothetical protein
VGIGTVGLLVAAGVSTDGILFLNLRLGSILLAARSESGACIHCRCFLLILMTWIIDVRIITLMFTMYHAGVWLAGSHVLQGIVRWWIASGTTCML